jgi:hypothetical protein
MRKKRSLGVSGWLWRGEERDLRMPELQRPVCVVFEDESGLLGGVEEPAFFF